MSKSGDKIIAGAEEALSIAKGEIPAPVMYFNGHRYIHGTKLTADCESQPFSVSQKLIDELAGLYRTKSLCEGLSAEITRLRAERDEAVKALEPFAKEAEVWKDFYDAECLVEDFPGLSLPSTINVGHLRTAAAIVKRGEDKT